VPDAYVQRLLEDGAQDLWHFGDPTGPAASNIGPAAHTAAYGGSFTLGAPGVLPDYTAVLFTSGYVVTAADPLSGATHFSMSVLIRVQVLAACYIVAYDSGPNANTESWYMFTNADASTDSGIFSAASVAHDAEGIPSIANSSWHQLVTTWDGTSIRNYLDGAFVGIASSSAWFKPGVLTLSMGGDNQRAASSSSRFQGYMSAAALFTTVLTNQQIQDEYVLLGQVAVQPVGQPATSGQVQGLVASLAAVQLELDLVLASVRKTFPTT